MGFVREPVGGGDDGVQDPDAAEERVPGAAAGLREREEVGGGQADGVLQQAYALFAAA